MEHIKLEQDDKELRILQWQVISEKFKRLLAEDAKKSVMDELRSLRKENAALKIRLEQEGIDI